MGCNQLLGIEQTGLDDGAVSVQHCPSPGATLRFTALPQTITSGAFPFSYTFDEQRTFAVAYIANEGIVEGAVDAPDLTPLTLDADPVDRLFTPRVSPEGDDMVVLVQNSTTFEWTLRRYARLGPMSWSRAETLASLPPAERISTPTRRASDGARHWVRQNSTQTELAEYIERAGVWTLIKSYDATALGVMNAQRIEEPQLSPDGLRLVFAVNEIVGRPIYFTDRATIDEPFLPARKLLVLLGDAEPRDPFLVSNCSRLYFTVYPGLSYVE